MDFLSEEIQEKIVFQAIQTLEKETNKEARLKAIGLLGVFKSEKHIIYLCNTLLKDREPEIRSQAASCLGEIGSPKAIEDLCKALNDQDHKVCESAAYALGKIGTNDALVELHNFLDKYELKIRIVVEAIEKIGNSQSLPRLVQYQKQIKSINQRLAAVITKIQLSCPPQETKTDIIKQINKTLKNMSETPKYDFSGASFTGITGSVTGNIQGDNIGTQHNYAPEQKQNLVEAAKEIQQLLDQLSQTYPTTTEYQKQAVVNQAIARIKHDNPTTWQRLRSATEAALIEAFKEVLDNPFVNITVAAVQGYRVAN